MKASEYAKELVDKFYNATDDHWNQWYVSKQCALIAIEELNKKEISLLGLSQNYESTWYNMVKQEINLL
jgi:hypothetical protein